MSLIGRLRTGGPVIALLTAVLLFAPMNDCALVEGSGHSHSAGASVAASAFEDSQVTVDADDAHCALHRTHCIVKSVLRAGADPFTPLRLIGAVLVPALVAAHVYRTAGGGVRGPPIATVPVAGGQAILTEFCISRR